MLPRKGLKKIQREAFMNFFIGKTVELLAPPAPCIFKIGDKVRCDLDVDVLKQMQEGHGGWNQRMAEVRRNLLSCYRSMGFFAASEQVFTHALKHKKKKINK